MILWDWYRYLSTADGGRAMHPVNDNPRWFSTHFGIDLPQYELEFVDFHLDGDVPVYIDPFAITKNPSDFAAECHNDIHSYFNTLLHCIQQGDTEHIKHLVQGKLSEPNEIHLGVSRRARRGRGLGNQQEMALIEALANSEAAKTGVIKAIAELELHIRGIGPDKISDLTANIILDKLALFTQAICETYGVPTRPCAVNNYWNSGLQQWDSGYFNLPVQKNYSYILVPKHFVRRERDLMNHNELYRKFILDYLQRELITANDSLVQTLKNGERRVTKKSIQDDPRFSRSKPFISEFIIEHEHVIEQYRDYHFEQYNPIDPAYYSGKSIEDDPNIRKALATLQNLQSGRSDAGTYHAIIYQLIKFLFDYVLTNFEIEYEMDGDRGRVDIIADNRAGGGVFKDMKDNLNANSIPMECKNYSTDIGNTEFNQMVDRLGKKTSQFGIIFCRTIDNISRMSQHQTDRWFRQNVKILLLDDNRVDKLVQMRLQRNFDGIENTLRQYIRAIEFGHTSQ